MAAKITQTKARNIMLTTLGLSGSPKRAAKKVDVLESIRQMGQLQIDTIHVVARSPYLVLFSRLGEYDPIWLDELLVEKRIFEYWSHAACFLPIEDYPLYRRHMLDNLRRWKKADSWMADNASTLEHVLGYVKKHKEVRSSDFKRTDGKKGAWWNWKAEKIALEVLFDEGELMIARRDKFRRVYTVRQRILPRWDDKDTPIYAETQKALAAKALKALGVATAPWIADYFYLPQREINGIMKILVEKGIALHVEVDDWGECFIHKDNVCLNESVKNATHTTLLSPFDPLINNRKRALSVFKFDYKIECYTPAAKRKYGYFTLPILWRGNLIGRLDPKAHRKDGVFEIKNIVFEDGIKITGELMADMAKAVQDCANWHGTPEVKVVKSTPKEVKNTLGNYL